MRTLDKQLDTASQPEHQKNGGTPPDLAITTAQKSPRRTLASAILLQVRAIATGSLPALVLLAALLALWQWYASQSFVDALLLPTPLAVWQTLLAQRDILWHHAGVTLYETLV